MPLNVFSNLHYHFNKILNNILVRCLIKIDT